MGFNSGFEGLKNLIAHDDVEPTIILAVWSVAAAFYGIQQEYISQ